MKTFTVEYEDNELEYRVLKELFLMRGSDEKMAQRLAHEYAKHFKVEVAAFQATDKL